MDADKSMCEVVGLLSGLLHHESSHRGYIHKVCNESIFIHHCLDILG